MRSDGSNPHQLTTLGINRRPVWTTDGLILFQSGRTGNFDIYRMNADGPHQVDLTNDPGDDRHAAPSPSGDRVVFTSSRSGAYHLYSISLDGSGLVQLTTGPGEQQTPANSDDGSHIAFAAFADPAAADDLWVMNADGSELRQLTATPDIDETGPTWSPSGRKLAFSGCTQPGTADQQCQLYVMPSRGGPATNVSIPHTFSDPLDDNHTDPLWFANGFGTGFASVETNGRLEESLAADSTPDPVTGFQLADYFGFCQMTGNFDMRVSFTQLDWPQANGVAAAIKSGSAEIGDTGDAFRLSQLSGELYSSFIPPSFASIPGSDLTGALRVVRAGPITTTYYRSGRRWIEIGAGLSIPGPANPGLSLEVDGGNFAHQLVRVGYTDFSATANGWICPSGWQDSSSDWGR